MLGSETQKVLQHTTIPVLVSAVESNLPTAEIRAPLAIIRDEHRSLAAVIHGLEFLVREARDQRNRRRRFRCCARCCATSRRFPETLHHPKEDAYLFRKLRARTREFDATLDELERQHVEGHALVDGARSRASPPTRRIRRAAWPAFAAAVERFATSQIAAHDARVEGDHPGRAGAPDRGRLGGDRRRLRGQRRTRASPSTTTRSSASCSRRS